MSTLLEINHKAQDLLRAGLGPVDYVRYQQQFSQGAGDYTAERQASTQPEIDDIASEIAALKREGLLPRTPQAKELEF